MDIIRKFGYGFENTTFLIKDNGILCVLKLFCKERTCFDGEYLIKKYNYFSRIGLMNVVKAGCFKDQGDDRVYIEYQYFKGKNKFHFSVDNLKEIAKEIYSFHCIKLSNEKCFDYSNSFTKQMLYENGLDCNLDNEDMCLIHGDFHPGNIIWDNDEKPHLIDLDNCSSGPREYDIANMRFDLALLEGVDVAESFYEYYCKHYYIERKLMHSWDLIVLQIQIGNFQKWTNKLITEKVITEKEIVMNLENWQQHLKQNK